MKTLSLKFPESGLSHFLHKIDRDYHRIFSSFRGFTLKLTLFLRYHQQVFQLLSESVELKLSLSVIPRVTPCKSSIRFKSLSIFWVKSNSNRLNFPSICPIRCFRFWILIRVFTKFVVDLKISKEHVKMDFISFIEMLYFFCLNMQNSIDLCCLFRALEFTIRYWTGIFSRNLCE